MKLQWHLYVLPFTFLIITLYFSFHLIQGERGIFRLFAVNQEIAKAEALFEQTNNEKMRLERRIQTVSETQIQDDMLEEIARHQFGFILPDEYVIYD